MLPWEVVLEITLGGVGEASIIDWGLRVLEQVWTHCSGGGGGVVCFYKMRGIKTITTTIVIIAAGQPLEAALAFFASLKQCALLGRAQNWH